VDAALDGGVTFYGLEPDGEIVNWCSAISTRSYFIKSGLGGVLRRRLTNHCHVYTNHAAHPEAGEDASLNENVRWHRGCLGSPDLNQDENDQQDESDCK
jgi:hypothetical protein